MADASPAGHDTDEDIESVASRDFTDDFSCNIFNPDLRIKLRKSLKGLRFGANITFEEPRRNGLRDRGLVLTMRPVVRGTDWKAKLVNKVSLDAKEGEMVWSMGKMQFFDIIKVKFAAGMNFRTKSPIWNYRVTTKWNQDDHRVIYKTPVHIGERLQLVPNFDIDYSLPAVGGGSGGHASETDGGSCHIKMPRVDFTVNLDAASQMTSHRKGLSSKEAILRELGSDEIIEEIPIIKSSEGTTTVKSQSKGFKRKQQKKDLVIVDVPHSASDSKPRRLPAPWGLSNPWKFPWITQENRSANVDTRIQSQALDISKSHRTKRPPWGLDAYA